MTFCSPFDKELAATSPAAIFVRNTDGEWRLAPDLTRDGRNRVLDPPDRDPAHALFRDKETGFVSWFYVTATALLRDHPRGEPRFYPTEAEAGAALDAIGRPPLLPAWPEEVQQPE